MAAYNIYEAKTRLSALLEKVSAGEDVVIARAGKPVARIVPLDPPAAREAKIFRNSFGANHGNWGNMEEILNQPLNEEEQRAFGMID